MNVAEHDDDHHCTAASTASVSLLMMTTGDPLGGFWRLFRRLQSRFHFMNFHTVACAGYQHKYSKILFMLKYCSRAYSPQPAPALNWRQLNSVV